MIIWLFGAAGAALALDLPPIIGKVTPIIGKVLPTAPVADGATPIITAVDLTGVNNAPKDALLHLLENAPQAELRAGEARRYDPLTALRDVRRIQRAYEAYGYFDVAVTVQTQPAAVGDGVRLTYQVQENKPTLIGQVELMLPDAKTRRAWGQRLAKVTGLKPGERFSLAGYEKAKEAVKLYLAENAHPKATVDGQVRVYKQKLTADVALKIDPGPKYYFGEPLFVGEPRTSQDYIRARLKFTPGLPFNTDALRASQQELLGTGFFSSAVLMPRYDLAVDGRLPIEVDLDERPAHQLQLGLGWGTEDGVRVRLDQTNRNVLGWNEELSFRGKVSEIYQGVLGLLRVPGVPLERTNLALRMGVEQPDYQAYQSRNYFGLPALEMNLGKFSRAWFGYLCEFSRMIELKAAVPDRDFENQHFFISSLRGGVIFDTRDSPMDPTRGSLLMLELEVASSAMGSDLDFVRPIAEASHVFPVPGMEHWYVAMRAKIGFCADYGQTNRIPLIRRFFPGGADSVRGYPYQSLGPLDSAGKPLGGEAMAVGNLELRFPLWQDLGGVLFVDVGNAYDSINADMGLLRYTAGVGLRYNTPVGPLRLDWGYQLNPDADAPIGDNQFYLSVGQAF